MGAPRSDVLDRVGLVCPAQNYNVFSFASPPTAGGTDEHRTPRTSAPSTRARRRSGSPAAGTAWAWPTTFRDGKPHAIEAFGGKLVVWADSQGKLNVLDGYCRHMGGDLTQGTVKGDEIACPFHDWRWGGDGKCKAIPYARRVPLRARTQKYATA